MWPIVVAVEGGSILFQWRVQNNDIEDLQFILQLLQIRFLTIQQELMNYVLVNFNVSPCIFQFNNR